MKTAFAIVLSAASLSLLAGLAPPSSQPAAPAVAPGAESALFTGAIDAVTVYRGQALVTRAIEVPGGAGLREIVVTGLPEAILPGSLYAESNDGLEVRSVSYRIRPVGEDSRESVRAAEKAVRTAHDALDAANAKTAFLSWQRQYLDKLEAFVAPAAQAELKSGVLNADTLSKLTDLVTTQRRTQTDEGQALALETRTLTEALQLKDRELAVLTANTSRTAREAVVFLNITKPGAKLRLTYVVSGANWTPSYNLRVSAAAVEKGTLEYQASVQQMSGEDWSNVQLTLSTATPALVATGPALMPLTVALVAPQQAEKSATLAMFKDKSYDEAKKAIVARQRDMEQNRQVFAANADRAGGAGGGAGNFRNVVPQQAQSVAEVAASRVGGGAGDDTILSLDAGLNELADQSQILDLVSSAKVERKSRTEPVTVRQGNEGVSVSYKVAGRTTMPSRADQQLIQIATLELPAKVNKAATPTLTQYIYNEASIANASDMVLLAGPAASYVNGEFVGSAGVPTVAAGESFRAGFGIDTSLRSSKELIERTESTQGGNRIIEFTYKLTLENFGKAPAAIRLLDRLPSPKDQNIKLTLVSQTPSLSEDKDYLETDRKRNLLRWDVTVPPGATGTRAFAVEYRFRIEFDKQMTVTEGQ